MGGRNCYGYRVTAYILIGAGIVFLLLELHHPGLVIPAVVGIALLVFGFNRLGSTRLVAPTLGFIALLMVLSTVITVRQVSRIQAAARTQALIGKIAVARTPLSPEGFVSVQGERWRARIAEGTAAPGARVRIVGAAGVRLEVEARND